MKRWLSNEHQLYSCWAVARNYEAMLEIYMEKYPVDDSKLKKATTDCFIQYRMAESMDKGLQMVSKVTKYEIDYNC
jgi:hypothetical protein